MKDTIDNRVADNCLGEANRAICSTIRNLSDALNLATVKAPSVSKELNFELIKQLRDEIKALNNLRQELR